MSQPVLKVTADSGANLKLLRKLEKQGFINITVVDLENGKGNKIKSKVGPVGVWGKFKWGDGSVWANKDSIYQDVLAVVGRLNYQDARQLEAHFRLQNHIFVTEDLGDILSNKTALKQKFGITVMSPVDLVSYIENRAGKK